VRGTPSHGSRPTRDNPVPRLVAALDRLARYETPLHVTPGVDRYFRDISREHPGERGRWLQNVAKSLEDPRAREWILSNVYWNAILRNTITLTGLQGSNKTNVIPPEASAEVDIRLLPDQDPDSVLATLKAVVADTAVQFTQLITPKAPFESSTTTDFFRAVERVSREHDPAAFVTSTMMTGATDRPMYRRLGMQVYGLDPFRTNDVEYQRGAHGNDERIAVANFVSGIRFLYDVLRYVQ
jgi:acetylornithine deacetylase/succinyl-diaminopimelate desuccinylase-like protein